MNSESLPGLVLPATKLKGPYFLGAEPLTIPMVRTGGARLSRPPSVTRPSPSFFLFLYFWKRWKEGEAVHPLWARARVGKEGKVLHQSHLTMNGLRLHTGQICLFPFYPSATSSSESLLFLFFWLDGKTDTMVGRKAKPYLHSSIYPPHDRCEPPAVNNPRLITNVNHPPHDLFTIPTSSQHPAWESQ